MIFLPSMFNGIGQSITKKFSELPRSFQRRIEETDIVVYQIQPGTPDDVKFDIFRRINTGGEPLSAQEIRHALNQGQVTQWLERLANSAAFTAATEGGISPKRMDDRECVLRFLAFSLSPPNSYEANNFDLFLNSAMQRANKLDLRVLLEYENLFYKAMNTAQQIFCNDAFRKRYKERESRYPINKALFEAWSVTLGKLDNDECSRLVRQSEALKTKFLTLMNDDKEFEAAISQGTGSVKRVRYRFAQIKRIIEECLV